MEQEALDRIHELAARLRKSVTYTSSPQFGISASSVRNRLALQNLKDVESLTVKLFQSNGMAAEEIIEKLTELEEESKSLYAQVTEVSSYCLTADDGDLRSLLEHVRNIEKSWDFQYQLWLDKNDLSKATGCSLDQFTYGSSSFSLWKSVFLHPLVESKLTATKCRNSSKVVVFGSSIGLIPFFFSHHFPHIPCDGYEVLPVLHAFAETLKQQYAHDCVTLWLRDMLQADVSKASVVVLTSLCWDQGTRILVAKKLQDELPPDCVVVDYQDNAFSVVEGLDSDKSFYQRYARRISLDLSLESKSHANAHFRVVGIVEGAVSWFDRQKLYLYMAKS